MQIVNMPETIWEIYGIFNKANGKMYIGQTKQGYRKRFVQHNKSDGCPALRKAIIKYGKQNFECELLDLAYTQEEANEKEKMWIYVLGTYKSTNGYNLSMGGSFGNFNDETLKKMSESHKGEKNHFFAKHHDAETRARMSALKKGKYTLGKHPQAKKVRCIETGEIFECAKAAGIAVGIRNASHIGMVANGQRQHAGGYSWEWV